ncbi:MAG: hypothetical protein JXC36_08725 [Candidatus Atribacteria bacterium]|nr:hypothetical protein [Candidatus Atribacteria bacterium]
MDIFKIGKGSFWGVIIPGGFVVANIFFVFYREYMEGLLSQSGLFIVLGILLSYIFGNVLKLIQPRVAEIISIPIQFIVSLFFKVIDTIRKLLRIREISWLKPKSFKWILQDFPYMRWFYEDYLEKLPEQVKAFFYEYKKREFSDDLDKMGYVFFNYCKHYAIENSNHLRDELYFHEGLMRFLNGMVYATIVFGSIIFYKSIHMNFTYQPYNLALGMYLFILLVILYRYKNVRRLETVTCFMSFYIVQKNKNDSDINQDGKNLNNDVSVQ